MTVMNKDEIDALAKFLLATERNQLTHKVPYGEFHVSKLEVSFDGEVMGHIWEMDGIWAYEPLAQDGATT